MDRGAQRFNAFTLIELLVVVAIIAMLVSILLPSMRGAREQARSVVCGQQLRTFGQGLAIYTNDNQDWLPGVNTSGTSLKVALREFFQNPGALYRPHVPVQTFDWMTPVINPQIELPDTRAKRFKYLLDDFGCPSHQQNSVLYADNLAASPDQAQFIEEAPWPAVSYLMPSHFQYAGTDYSQSIHSVHGGGPRPLTVYWTSVPQNFSAVHDTFLPRLDEVGRDLARKIFVADGTRYLPAELLLDHDVAPDPTYFGSFTSSGGWWGGSTAYGVISGSAGWSGRTVGRGSPSEGQNLALSYRHGTPGNPTTVQANDGRLNVVFFDGHVESLADRRSRDIELWYPTGTVVQSPTDGLTDVPQGFAIP